ncbi:hypothetical protein EK21DRAFT_103589 [Setomelanomma holmii]|uniref:Uncharacterized protein n=1 Tax=Setomelanomma holmii TaxID=210430 RepID=A0A9P4H2L6_9PLEO|nr:hypothetical protein EK21DRAFT_103589 [Setomelanomma holmii]
MEQTEHVQHIVGMHIEPTLDYTSDALTPSHSQTKLARLPEIVQPVGPVERLWNRLCLEVVEDLPKVTRFLHLSRQSKALIKAHGPHTTFAGTTVFSRAPLAHDCAKDVSVREFALSLAAAQDSIGTAQLNGPAKEDLAIFECLWSTTVDLLESMISTGDLDHETFEDSLLLAHKTRLHDAHLKMPCMDGSFRREKRSLRSRGQVDVLAKANREAHVCATLLLQRFRREDWTRIRWFHGVQVVVKLTEHVGLDSLA